MANQQQQTEQQGGNQKNARGQDRDRNENIPGGNNNPQRGGRQGQDNSRQAGQGQR